MIIASEEALQKSASSGFKYMRKVLQKNGLLDTIDHAEQGWYNHPNKTELEEGMMFQLIKGANIPDTAGLKEEYQINDNVLYANVSAENIQKVFEKFLGKMQEDEPLFLFIETPCSENDEQKLNNSPQGKEHSIEKFHRDVFYLDGYCREQMLMILQSGAGDLLINDGLVCFGFGSMASHIELGKYKYNVLTGYLNGNDADWLTAIFDDLGITCVSEIITAWQLISKDNPGESRRYEYKGKDIFTLIDQLKELGLYKAETRDEDTGEVVWRA